VEKKFKEIEPKKKKKEEEEVPIKELPFKPRKTITASEFQGEKGQVDLFFQKPAAEASDIFQ
jgi:hypothetical protein